MSAEEERIGRYAIERVVGEGSFGTVYLAQEVDELERQVALKVLRNRASSEKVRARFVAERHALAMMEHETIAKIFDSGESRDGRPYFAMEFVDGVPITEYCERRGLGVGARLRLFQAVCGGVQHAHQKGVIHRDLKPTNILIAERDGQPVPKIIDFGLARAEDRLLNDEQLPTLDGEVLGTLAYMSPEQARADRLGIDTRTDIYSLGVVLYELLTGLLPFDPDSRPGLDEAVRALCEGEPPSPSARLLASASPEARASAAGLRGDLDWIVARALAKDPDRRYATPASLAADLGRHLRHEPVEAGPPGALYRLRKFFRRRRVELVAAALVLVSVVVGLALALVEGARAEENLAKFQLLANAVSLEEVRAEEAGLYPAWPHKADAMRSWIEQRAEPLAAELPRLRAMLADLRRRAAPWSDADRAQDRSTHPDAERLAGELAEIDQLAAGLAAIDNGTAGAELDGHRRSVERELERLRASVARLQDRLGERRTFRYVDPADQYLDDALTKLEHDLAGFVDRERGALAAVRDRLQWAEAVRRLSIDANRSAWDAAIAAIARSDGSSASREYDHLQLSPQLGLVPVGMDPESKLWEFVHLRSGVDAEIPTRDPDTGELHVTEDTGIVFVLLPGGRFHMGAQNDDPAAANYDPHARGNESPVRELELGPFFLARTEMTQGQWLRLSRGDRPSHHRPARSGFGKPITWLYPVEQVSWDACIALLEHDSLTLPTEVEWEYACRGGSAKPWYTGDEIQSLAGHANIADRSAHERYATWICVEWDDGYVGTSPAGSYPPNGFGLHDMLGNVWEWCRDDLPGTPMRAVRGGSFVNPVAAVRSAYRGGYPADRRNYDLGLRPARRLVP